MTMKIFTFSKELKTVARKFGGAIGMKVSCGQREYFFTSTNLKNIYYEPVMAKRLC